MQFTQEEFQELKSRVEEEYKTFGEIRCPYLGEKVTFNTNGIAHIEYKKREHPRSQEDQFMRLKLLHVAPIILKMAHHLQGFESKNTMERIKVRDKWVTCMVRVTYYEFIGIYEDCRVIIIVKKIDNGKPFFWSIIPYWKQRDGRRSMFEGNSEED